MLLLLPQNVKAEEKDYIVAEATPNGYREIDRYSTYYQADYAFENEKDNVENAVILMGDKVLKMEYGVVEFHIDEGCKLELEYTRKENGESGKINGCYGIDALYLATDRHGEQVDFLISGDRGRLSVEEVTLHPYQTLKVRTSTYTVKNRTLYHGIKSQLKTDYYYANLAIGDAPEKLKENTDYYSYDGHYFFSSFRLLSEAYQTDNYQKALNANNPYYAYFQYLSNRSISQYEPYEIEEYLRNKLSYDSRMDFFQDKNRDSLSDAINESQYVGEIDNFYAYQYQYGANAMLMLAISMSESGNGKSLAAYTRNHLFAQAAYDSEKERSESRYLSVQNAIRSQAKYYISRHYSSYRSSRYHGSFLGNKRSGMNVSCSSDPYWGEKAAQQYYRIDKALGGKDNGAYALAIVESPVLNIYKDAEKKEIEVVLQNIGPLSFVVLERQGDVYKIQTEMAHQADYRYQYSREVGYISAEDVQLLLYENKIQQNEYVMVHFSAQGGQYDGEEVLHLEIPKGRFPIAPVPQKKKAVFKNYQKEVQAAQQETAYQAIYREVASLTVENFPREIEQGLPLDLRGVYGRVHYKDGETVNISLNTDNVWGYRPQQAGAQSLFVRLAGQEVSQIIRVSEEKAKQRKEIEQHAEIMFTRLQNKEKIALNELFSLRQELADISYNLDIEKTQLFDAVIYEQVKDHLRFVIEDPLHLDVGISGLNLAYPITQENFDGKVVPNILGVRLSALAKKDERHLRYTAESYGYEVIEGFFVQPFYNLKNFKAQLPLVISVRIYDPQKVYSVYAMDSDGNLSLCSVMQSENFIRFLAPGEGSYLLVAKESNNTYKLKDVKETLHIDNTDRQVYERFFRRILLAGLAVFSLLMITLLFKLEEGIRDTWNVYKKSLQIVAIVPAEKQKH